MDRRTFLASALAAPAIAYSAPPRKVRRVSPLVLAPKQRLGDDLYAYINAAGGDDANSGWTKSEAKRTLQATYDYAKSTYDFNGHGMEIHLAPTNVKYSPIKVVSSLIGYHIFNIIGDGPEPNSCIIRAPDGVHCVDVQDYAAVGLMNVGLLGGAGSCGIACRQHTIVDYGNVAFWEMGGSHVFADSHAEVSCIGPEAIYGGADVHWNVGVNSALHMSGGPCHLNSALAFRYFLYLGHNATFKADNLSYSGAGAGSASTGKQWHVQLNGVATLGPQNPPGTIAGTPARSAAQPYGGVVM